MKKIFTSILVCLLTIFMTTTNIGAYDNELKKAYNSVITYYENNKTLCDEYYYLDSMIAVELLGFDIEEDNFKIYQKLETIDFSKATFGQISKSIIILSLMGKDPKNFNNYNLVDILEGYITDNNTVDKDDDTIANGEYKASSGDTAWVLFALETVSSSKVEIAANYLVRLMGNDGGFVSYGASNPDVTGWCIEALTLTNNSQYVAAIKKAKDYLKNDSTYKIDDEGLLYWSDVTDTLENPYHTPANANTEGAVLTGLLVNDRNSLMDGDYDKEGKNHIDTLLKQQNNDGSFKAYYMEGANDYATAEAARCLYTYINQESFIEKAKEKYSQLPKNISLNVSKKTLNQGETLQLNAILNPSQSSLKLTWSVDNPKVATVDKNGKVIAISEGKTTIRVKTKSGLESSCEITVIKKKETNNKQTTSTSQKASVVETDDDINMTILFISLITFGGLYLGLRKKDGIYE